MRSDEVIQRFRDAGALLEGHFVLTSGLHSSRYLQCALVLHEPAQAEEFGSAIASHFQNSRIHLVASPAIGGIIVGYEVARALGTKFLWTEREAGRMSLRRGFSIEAGERTLVVEDVLTTGGSTRETIETLRALGADVVAAASIIDRSGGEADVGVPRIALANVIAPAVDPDHCELCQQGIPAIKPGSRRQ